MGIFKSLNRQQREAVGLLQIGTFLEFFDLMLYVHMALILNELFFPATDPHTASLIAAFSFCSTFVLRPFGALIFGYIGDNIGRKTTVIITTMMMSVSCIIMANLPTYAQIGISAAWIVTICRIVQGLSSMGEIMGAQVYLTEITKPPAQHVAVSFMSIAASFGAVVALGVATLVTKTEFNWRIAFWVGAGIAVVGSIARTTLRETPEFLEKLSARKNKKDLKNENIGTEVTSGWIKTITGVFIIFCGWPLTFYICFMYFNPILQKNFGYSLEDIIFHNFLLSFVQLFHCVFFSFMSYRIHPLKILKVRAALLLLLIIPLPFLILYATSPIQIFMLQSGLMVLSLSELPGIAIFIKYFPVLKRMTAVSFLYSLSRAIMYVAIPFGLIYVTDTVGHYGLWIAMIPSIIAFMWAIDHFGVLEGIRTPRISSIFGYKNKHDESLPVHVERSEDVDKKVAV